MKDNQIGGEVFLTECHLILQYECVTIGGGYHSSWKEVYD